MEDPALRAEIAAAVTAPKVTLDATEIDDLLAFLDALTDPAGIAGQLGIPDGVPSGLPVER